MVLEDLDDVEERRRELRASKRTVAPELVGSAHDPNSWRRLFTFAVPAIGPLLVAMLLAVFAAVAKVAALFLMEGVLQPLFEQHDTSTVAMRVFATINGLGGRGSSFLGAAWDQVLAVRDGLTLLWNLAPPLSQLRWASAGIVLLVVIEQANKYCQRLIMQAVSLNVVQRIREALFAKVLSLSMRFFHKNHSSKLMSRITNDITKLGKLLVDVMVNMVTDFFTALGAFAYIWVKGETVILVGLLIVAATFGPLQQLGRRLRNRESKNQRKMSGIFQSLGEALGNQKIVKAFQAQDLELKRFHEANVRYTAGRIKSAELEARAQPVVEVIGAFGVAALLYLGGSSVLRGDWEGGAFFAVVVALYQFVGSLRRLGDTATKLQGGLSCADRVSSVLYNEPEIVDAEDAVELDGLTDAITFDHVTYSHDGERDVLCDVDFRLPRGATLALVGHTGSGKSTIGDLLLRLYDVDHGRVLVDGHDIRHLTVESLRRQIAVVTQETVLFQGTIASNIAYGMPDASPEDIEEAARAAFAHEFIVAFPEGYQTPVGERGLTLSGGERQRIAIARALLRDAPILILDEATSALDSRSEKVVQEAIERLKAGRTTIVIAHRLSTIRDADQILLLEKGAVAERGTHDELIALGGHYAGMISLQRDG